MLTDDILDRFQRIVGGGITTDESRWDFDYLFTLLNTYSRQFLIEWFNGSKIQAANRSIPNQYVQEYFAEYDESFQDKGTDYVKFKVPISISINGNTDGIRFSGTYTKTDKFDFSNVCAISRVKDAHELSMLMQIRFTANRIKNGLKTVVLYDNAETDGGMGIAKVYGNTMLKNLYIRVVAKNPADIPTWNRDFHDYPMADNHLDQIEQRIMQKLMPQKAQIPDTTNNFSEQQQAQK